MKKIGSELIFISRIERNGLSVAEVGEGYLELLQKETFELVCLSMSERTYIAFCFNAFVVKLKK